MCSRVMAKAKLNILTRHASNCFISISSLWNKFLSWLVIKNWTDLAAEFLFYKIHVHNENYRAWFLGLTNNQLLLGGSFFYMENQVYFSINFEMITVLWVLYLKRPMTRTYTWCCMDIHNQRVWLKKYLRQRFRTYVVE